MTVGPINAFNGFPFWYKDGNGLRLQLNFDTTDPYSGISLQIYRIRYYPFFFLTIIPKRLFIIRSRQK